MTRRLQAKIRKGEESNYILIKEATYQGDIIYQA
jgi:hypothetical protein